MWRFSEESTLRVLLCGWVVCLLMVTMFPFHPGEAPAGQLQIRDVTAADRVYAVAREFVLNVVLFVPLGVLLARTWRRRFEGLALLAVVGVVGLGVSLTVESVQLLLPRRDTAVMDLLANTAGALAGAWLLAPRLRRAEGAGLRLSPKTVVLGIVGFVVFALAISTVLQARSRIDSWDASYPLVVGNEATGDRPWRGRIRALEMTDTAVSRERLRQFAAGGDVSLPGTRLVAFDFAQGPPYRSLAGGAIELQWAGTPGPSGAEGVEVTSASWLQTAAGVPLLVDGVEVTSAFALRIVCATGEVDQQGPARIVSSSYDTGLRNFTIGQDGPNLVVRVRTPLTGANGNRPEVVVPGVFASTGWRDLLVTYDGANLSVATLGGGRVHRAQWGPGPSFALTMTSLPVRDTELPTLKAMYLIALFLAPGVVAGAVRAPLRVRLLLGAGAAVALAVLLEAALAFAGGRSFNWHDVSVSLGLGIAVVATLVAVGCRQPLIERYAHTIQTG